MEKGKNIILSIVLNMGFLPVYQQFHLNIVTAVACLDLLNCYTNKNSIKWPNDLYWNDSKAGGILIENLIRGDNWGVVVVGIGININERSFQNDLPIWYPFIKLRVSIDDVVDGAKELHMHVLKRFNDFKKNGPRNFIQFT